MYCACYTIKIIDHEDFSDNEHSITFLFGSLNCISHHIDITNDNINEATEQVFVIQLSLIRCIDPNKIHISRSTSLGVIIDDDRELFLK